MIALSARARSHGITSVGPDQWSSRLNPISESEMAAKILAHAPLIKALNWGNSRQSGLDFVAPGATLPPAPGRAGRSE